MIAPDQCRAAREKLRWSQAVLAKRSGVSQPTIAQFESEKVSNPNSATLDRLQKAFEHEGIVFTANGLHWDSGASYRIEGDDWWVKVLDDVYRSLVDQPDAELILLGADDRLSSADTNNRWRKIRNAGVRMRQFVCEGNTYLLGPVKEYRYLPESRFVGNVTALYGDRIAICADDNSHALVVKDAKLAASWRNVIEILWDTLKQPERSTADERF